MFVGSIAFVAHSTKEQFKMASKQLKTAVRHAAPEFHGYEFLGP